MVFLIMQIYLRDLITTQNSLRNMRQVGHMIEFIRQGGKFTFDARLAQHVLTEEIRSTPPPMHISFMEDGSLMLHDGHHRAVAMLLGGREWIDDSEYESGHYTYDDYANVHPERGWYTPFNLYTEVRKPDFGWFKNNAKKIYERNGIHALKEFIRSDHETYAEPRRIKTIDELTQVYINIRGTQCQKKNVKCAVAS